MGRFVTGMAKTHMLRWERVQYREIRLALGPMCSTGPPFERIWEQ
jgi:hypothetical protein